MLCCAGVCGGREHQDGGHHVLPTQGAMLSGWIQCHGKASVITLVPCYLLLSQLTLKGHITQVYQLMLRALIPE